MKNAQMSSNSFSKKTFNAQNYNKGVKYKYIYYIMLLILDKINLF